MKFNGKIFILTILIGLILLFRFLKLGQIPQALYWDELAIGFDAYAISETGLDIHGQSWHQPIFLSYGDYKAPLAIWLTSISFKIFNQSEWALRLPFALISVSGAIAFWLLLQALMTKIIPQHKSFHSTIALIGFLFLITTPWHFHFSRIGFESGLSLNLLIIAILCTWYGLHQNSRWFIPAALIATATVYAYISARYITPIFLGSLLLVSVKQVWQKKWWVSVTVSMFLLLQLPIYQSPHYQASQQYRLSAQNILTDGKVYQESAQLINDHDNSLIARIYYHRYLFLAKAFLHNYASHFTVDFLFRSGDTNLRHHTGWGGQLLIITIPFVFLGMYWMAKNFKNPLSPLTICWLLTAPLTAAIPYEIPHASRAIYLLIPMTLIITFGVVQLFELLGTNNQFTKFLKFLPAIIIASIILNFSLFQEDYFNHYSSRSARAWQLGNKYIGQIVNQEKSRYQKILIPGDFWMPVNSILFYNPELVLKIQAENLQTPNSTLWWRDGNIDTIFQQLTNVNANTLILTTTKDQKLGQIQELYLYPDGSDLLFKVQPANNF